MSVEDRGSWLLGDDMYASYLTYATNHGILNLANSQKCGQILKQMFDHPDYHQITKEKVTKYHYKNIALRK